MVCPLKFSRQFVETTLGERAFFGIPNERGRGVLLYLQSFVENGRERVGGRAVQRSFGTLWRSSRDKFEKEGLTILTGGSVPGRAMQEDISWPGPRPCPGQLPEHWMATCIQRHLPLLAVGYVNVQCTIMHDERDLKSA